MKKIFLTFFLIQWIAVVSYGQRLIATAQPSKITKGQVTRITYHFNGQTDASIQLPEFLDFSLINGPSQINSVRIINGRKTVSKEVRVDLLPLKTGIIKIPPASIMVGNKRIQSNPLLIHVSQDKNQSKGIADNLKQKGIALIAEINKDTVYQGEQIVLSYKLVYSEAVKQYDILHESNYDGCLRATFNLNLPTQIDTIDGIVYREKVLAWRSIFPYHEGNYKIDPMVVKLYVQGEKQNRNNGFFTFFRSNLKAIRVLSDALEFYVLPQNINQLDSLLPMGKPAIKVVMPSDNYTTDDMIPIKVMMQGNCDPSLLRAPILKSSFPLNYPTPKQSKINKSVNTDGITYLKTFEYYIQPQDTGIMHFHFASPYISEQGDIDTIITASYSLPVAMGKHYGKNIALPAMKQEQSQGNFYVYLVFGLLVLTGIIIGIAYLRKRIKKQNAPPEGLEDLYEIDTVQTIDSSLKTADKAIMLNKNKEGIGHLLKALNQTALGILGKDINLQYGTDRLYNELYKETDVAVASQWQSLVKALQKMQYGQAIKEDDISGVQREVDEWIKDKFPYIKDNK